jgi:chitodextrinase
MVFFSLSALAGPCSEFKQKITAKKGTCKTLPAEQRAACKAEIKTMKQELKACKMQAKANKGKKKSSDEHP